MQQCRVMAHNSPTGGGGGGSCQLTLARPEVRVGVLARFSDDESVVAALRAGARGFLTKNAGAQDILQAMSLVRAGHAQLDPSIQGRLVDAIARGDGLCMPDGASCDGASCDGASCDGAGRDHGAARARPAGGRSPDGLTAREAEVLAEIAAGLSNAEIAAKFFVSDTTVKTHINHLLAKTRMRDRAQLVAYAFRLGLAG